MYLQGLRPAPSRPLRESLRPRRRLRVRVRFASDRPLLGRPRRQCPARVLPWRHTCRRSSQLGALQFQPRRARGRWLPRELLPPSFLEVLSPRLLSSEPRPERRPEPSGYSESPLQLPDRPCWPAPGALPLLPLPSRRLPDVAPAAMRPWTLRRSEPSACRWP